MKHLAINLYNDVSLHLQKLKSENDERSRQLEQSNSLSETKRFELMNKFNVTLDNIKGLESLLEKHSIIKRT